MSGPRAQPAVSPADSFAGLTGRRATRGWMAPFSLLVAIVLALTPITAILVLGWLARVMRREAVVALARHGLGLSRSAAIARLSATPAIADLAGFPGWMRGLGDTLRSGMAGVLAVSLATLPFGALFLLAWWAGWENSFNKGYEQAWVGPLLAFSAALIAVPVLSLLPMALAHHAETRRVGAVLEIGLLWRLVLQVRWRYLVLTLSLLAAAAPLGFMRVLPVFIENVRPGFADASPEVAKAVAFRWHLATTAYLIPVLVILRSAAAHLYARSWLAACPVTTGGLSTVANALGITIDRPAKRRPGRLGGLLAALLIAVAWIAFLAMLFVTQFANHAWWNWLNHPLIGLPWVFRPL
ncbi:MAG: hypothetical protein AB7O57_00030 [Hyphomicrobiaceae bacterium]